MAFKDASRNLQEFVWDFAEDSANIDGLLAVLAAAPRNPYINARDQSFAAGKYRDLNLILLPPNCDDDGEEIGNICEGGRSLPPSLITFRMGQITSSDKYILNKDDIRLVDDDIVFSEYAMQMIASTHPTVRERLHEDVLTLLLANRGLLALPNGDTVAKLPVGFVDPITGAISPRGMDTIDRVFLDNKFNRARPVIIGGQAVWDWKKARGRASDSLSYAQDFRKLETGENLFYDPKVPNIIADPTSDHIIAFTPDVLKFMSFNNNAGIFATDMKAIADMDELFWRSAGGTIHGSMVDRRTGLIWDLDIKYDDCNNLWRFQWYLLWDIYFMPSPVCNPQGVNGIFHFTTCLPAAIECPTPEELSPIEAQTFEFDTNGEIAYEYFIQTLQAGTLEKDFAGLNQVDNIAGLAAMLNDFLAPLQIQLEVAGTVLSYSGNTAITIVINGEDGLTFEFEPA